MGAPITEFYIEQLIKTGLEDIRNNPSKLDMIYAGLNEGIFKNLFGKKVIDDVKKYVLNRKIYVIHGINIIPENTPCYSIQVSGSFEDHSRAGFDDFDSCEMEDIELPNRESIASFVIDSYDSQTGFCAVSDGVDLSSLYIGGIINDQNSISFEVLGPIISRAGAKGFYIVSDASIEVGTVSFISQIDETKSPVRAVPITDKVLVGIHVAENTNLTKYLYYLFLYWMFSRRIELENAGYQLSKYSATDLIKNVELLPDNIISRGVTIDVLTWFKWKEDPWTAIKTTRDKLLVKQYDWVKDDDSAIGTTTD